jgi:hypothetical protein
MDKNRNITAIIIGSVLIIIGVLALFGNFFNFLNMDALWPLIVMGVGIAFFIAMALGDKSRAGLAVPGSILVMIGLILFFMNATNNWEAWSYCWALIIFAVGAGVWINGYRSDQPELRKRGQETMRSGLILFVIFAIIMEFIFTMIGLHYQTNTLVWASLLAILGLVLLVSRILQLRKPEGEHVDLFWPILMIGAGITAILYELGWIPASNLWMMLNLWPLLLIVGGVGLIFRSRTPWVGALLGLLVVAGMLTIGLAGAQLNLPSQPAWFADIADIGDIQFGNVEEQQITGSGKLVTEDRPIRGVDRVDLAIPAKLDIVQGSTEALTITADDNILPYLTTNVSGGKLLIRYQPQVQVRPSQPPQITLTVKDLKGVQVSSSGSMQVGPITTDDFDLALSSSGSIDIQELQAANITADLTSSGDITVRGEAKKLNLDVSSSGAFQAGDLKLQEAVITLSSSGAITVWVTDDLRAKISSSGNIYYYGNPTVHSTLTSSGKVIPKGDK